MTTTHRVIEGDVHPAVVHFIAATNRVENAGYGGEIQWCRDVPPVDTLSPDRLATEYTFAVFCSSGLKEQVSRKHFNAFMDRKNRGDQNPFDLIFNRRMKDAIIHMWAHSETIFKKLMMQPSDGTKIEYLATLQQIGKKEKYHLARNIGIDCVKPDRHMERLAAYFGFKTPLEMCIEIQKTIPERLGVIDVILWRDCNLYGVPE